MISELDLSNIPTLPRLRTLEVNNDACVIVVNGVRITFEFLASLTEPDPRAWFRLERVETKFGPTVTVHVKRDQGGFVEEL